MGSISYDSTNGDTTRNSNRLEHGDLNGSSSTDTHIPIAIIGMSCRFPGDATSPEKLWQLVAEGRSAWSEIPSDRFNKDAFYHPSHENLGTSNVLGGHFLQEDVSLFDASFFNFSTEVAGSMDPQYRLQLESTFEALESAGLPISDIAGTETSVYAGAFFRDYHDSLMRDPEQLPRYFMTGNGAAMISNRISHFFDLRGPSMTIDTGCSTGLTALHLGCQSIRTGESKVSIIGGANVMINPDMFISMSMLGLLGADGKSYTFDSRGSGYGRGEGVATVILKPLTDALRDGDPIRAVIRETALNQDGKTATITSPSQSAQEDLIRACYRNAGLDLGSTNYVEAHGTGTRTGDPIEAGAIGTVFRKSRPADNPLLIGSVKSNIGHLEAASGLAAVIKTAMAFEKNAIPPSVNYEKPNPGIDFEALRLRVPTQLQAWPQDQYKRASISNFGYGGTNAHVIMDDQSYFCHTKSRTAINGHSAPYTNGILTNGTSNGVSNGSVTDKGHVFLLSAKDESAARAMVANLRDHLEIGGEEDNQFAQNLAYTLGQRRSLFPWKVAVQAKSVIELKETLEDKTLKPLISSEAPRLGFVFNGQGAQWYAMGRELIGAYPVFADTLQRAEVYLKELGAPWLLIEELTRDEKKSRVNEASLSLPLSCAIQLALVDLLASWGIRPTAVTGHSSGEVGAAYAAGAINLREALAIVYVRGALTQGLIQSKTVRGGMLAVGLGPTEAEPYLSKSGRGEAVIACVNSPASVTVSGDVDAIEDIQAALNADGVFARRLKVEAAYHSHHMGLIKEDYLASLKSELGSSGNFDGVKFSSPVSGELVDFAKQLGPEHWVRNMVQPVLFSQSLRSMCLDKDNKQLVDTVVEIGPHGALAGPIRQNLSLPELKKLNVSYGSCLSRGQDAVQTMQSLACFLICKGYPVDLRAVNFPTAPSNLQVIHDLPAYPWNHSVRHWMESRMNREYRHRKLPPHDLLGCPIAGNNAMAPTWRHIIRSSEVPWVREHMVQSDMVYPGAGCIIMAIEAVRQIFSANEASIAGYMLEDIEISKALVIPDTLEGIEVQLSLQKCSEKALDTRDWHSFHVYSVDGDGNWGEHCRGLISPKYQDAHEQLPGTNSTDLFNDSLGAHTRRISVKDFFQSLKAIGIEHGPSFQNLESIQVGQDKSVATFRIADTANIMPAKHQSKHLLHPITLDALFQAAYSAVPRRAAKGMGAAIPRSIKTMFVSAGISSNPGHQLQTLTQLRGQNSQGFDVTISLKDSDEATSGTVLEIDGMHYQSLGNSLAQVMDTEESKVCMTTAWENDLSMMRPEQLHPLLVLPADPSEAVIIDDLKRATSLIIKDTMAALTDSDIKNLQGHHRIMFDWMLEMDRRADSNEIAPSSSKWARTSEGVKQFLFEKVSNASVNGKMLCRVGQSLPAILRREVAPLELMLEDKLLYTYYENALRVNRSLVQVGQLAKLFAHLNPRAKVLEIGGGTGACTGTVLNALGGSEPGSVPRFSRYDFTDISSGFFEEAREKFQAWGDLVTYQKLDVEQDLVPQGFELGSYDLIIACQVLHATKGMDHTMRNVHSLLKPGGKLIMVETTQDAFDVCLVFGTLEGWWLSEEKERKLSPNLPVDLWRKFLARTNFSLDVEVPDSEDKKNYAMSVIMATALADTKGDRPSDVALVHTNAAPPESWLEDFQKATGLASKPTVEHLSTGDWVGKTCVFLGEVEQHILDDIDGETFTAVKKLLTEAGGLLWVTRGATSDCNEPKSSLHTGLLRTLRLEDATKRFVSLDLDPQNDPWTTISANAIADVFKRTYDDSLETKDFEYAERGSIIQVPRVYEDKEENDAVVADTDNLAPEMQEFVKPGRELRLNVGTPGMLDTLVFHETPSTNEVLPEDYVEIEPKAFGLNFRDIMVAMGQLQEKIMGFECGGVVTRLGPNPTHDLKVGDRVCALTTRGHWANFIRIHWTGVAKIPDHMSFDAAASIPMVFVTAWFSLVTTAHLQKSESVLIHAGSGGVGQAAIIIAKHIGAEIFVTVGSKEKREFITNTYGIQPDHILSSRDPSFATDIMKATNGRGVDVVLNSLSGLLLQESWKCVATLGRFVEIGKKDIQANKNLGMEVFGRGISFSAVDLIHLGNHNGLVMSQTLTQILQLLDNRSLVPIQPITVYPISDLQRAFRTMQAGKHLGKIVVVPKPDDLVKVLPHKTPVGLSPDASYLIIGGLGGIGRSISQWFVQNGAKNLILLSRTAASKPVSQAFVKELQTTGCRVELRNCDIADASDLTRVLKDCSSFMPPVKGVVQGAMVLNDSVFERMPFEKWQAAVRPKVQGTINLHECTADSKLDFFIMFSSATGVLGNPSQGNYAAGGTFQDAFARHLSSKGLPAVSIDLGMVKSVGYVAETKGVAERLAKLGYRPLEEEEVLRIVEAAIRNPTRALRNSQIITGLAPFDRADGIPWREEPRFLGLKKISAGARSGGAKGGEKKSDTFNANLSSAPSWTVAVDLVVDAIIKKLSEMFMIPEAEIDRTMPMSKYGVDSLVAVELRNWLVSRARADISLFDILQSSSLEVLAGRVAAKSRLVADAGLVAPVEG